MLESPVQVDTASSAIFNVVLIHSSALWTLCHSRLLVPSLQILMFVVPLSGSFHPLLQGHRGGIAQLGLCSATIVDATASQKLDTAAREGGFFPVDAW